MAIKRVFACASCGTEFSIDNSVYLAARPIGVWNQPAWAVSCEGCFQDGVLDDININGDMAGVNTSEVY